MLYAARCYRIINCLPHRSLAEFLPDILVLVRHIRVSIRLLLTSISPHNRLVREKLSSWLRGAGLIRAEPSAPLCRRQSDWEHCVSSVSMCQVYSCRLCRRQVCTTSLLCLAARSASTDAPRWPRPHCSSTAGPSRSPPVALQRCPARSHSYPRPKCNVGLAATRASSRHWRQCSCS